MPKYKDENGNWVSYGGGSGTGDYEALSNKPSINGVELVGNNTADDLGLVSKEEAEAEYATKEYVDDMPLKTVNGQSLKGTGNIEIDISDEVVAEKIDEYLVEHPIEGATVEYVNALDAEKFDKTEQPQGENYNLLGVDDCSITATDVTLTVEDGVFTINGTAGAVRELNFQSFLKSPLLPSGNYYVMFEKLEGSNIGGSPSFQYASGKAVNITPMTQAALGTFTVDMNRAKLNIGVGDSFTNYAFHLWINSETDGVHEYQPYGESGGSGEVIYSLKTSVEIPKLDTHSQNTDLHFTSDEKAWVREQIGGTDAIFANEITDTAQKCFAQSGEKCLSFAFMSDTHTYMSDDTSVKQYDDMIQHVKAVDMAYPFDFMVHCGDFVNTQWLWQYSTITDEQYQQVVAQCANKLRKSGIKDIFVPMGNHDSGYLGNNAEYSANILNYKNVQRAYNENGIVVRDGANPWFYVDYPNYKIRCLFISTSVNSTVSEIKGIHYNEAVWLKATLESIEADWNVLMFGHISFARFWTAMNRESTSAFVSIINGFSAHTTVDLGGSSLDCDFTSKTGKVLAYFCGHYHGDSIILPSDTRAKLTCPEISVAAGGYKSSGVITTGDWYDSTDSPSREYGTVTQDAWDAVVVKLTSNEIKLVRFGAGSDRTVSIS